MAQMTKEQLYNYLIGNGMVQAGRNPGTLSVDLGDNTGYITQFTTPEGFRESQVADVANPAGFNTPFVTPADWMAQIDNMTYVPNWNQALKEADNGGFMADYGWMLPLAIAAGGPMIGGLGAAGTGGAISAAEAAAAMGGGVDAAGWGLGSLDVLGAAEAGGMLSGYNAGAAMDAASGAYNAGAVMDAAGAAGGYDAGALLNAATTAAASGGGAASSLIPGFTNAQLVSGGLSLVGGLLSGNAAQNAAETTANAQLEAARMAAEAAKFKPFGLVATDPRIKAQQAQIFDASQGMLNQFTQSPQTTAPMGTAAQRAMSLGNQYLATDPQAQAQKYYNDQQALMATQRARDQAGMLTGEFNRGTYGLATGATGQMGAANPRLEAMYNAQRQQDLGLAAAATQGGMDYAKFGTGMVDAGGGLLKSMYGTQVASAAPWQTALGMGTSLEGDAGGTAAKFLGQGMVNAAQTQQAGAYSPLGTALMGGANAIQGWQNQTAQQNQQAQQNQMLATALAQPAQNAGGFFGSAINSMPQEWQWGGNWT